MANKVLLKKSSVGARVPVVGDLDYGELALNYADGKLYYKTSSNTIKSFTEDTSVVTLTGTQTLTNKTLSSAILTGTLTAGGGVGTAGQILSSTGSGVQWITSAAGSSGTVTSITAGTGLTGGTITTSGTIAIDSTVATLTGSQTLTNKTLTTPIIAEIDATADLTLDAVGDIILDADGADILLKDGGTTFGSLTNSGGQLVIKSGSTPTTAITFANDDITVSGDFAATTKSFLIQHPTKEGMKLRYGSLEGPENGVYVRGRVKENVIELPEYWTKLVDSETITVNLTPVGSHQNLFVESILNNKVYIKNSNVLNKSIDCFFVVYGERCDVDKLKVEYAA